MFGALLSPAKGGFVRKVRIRTRIMLGTAWILALFALSLASLTGFGGKAEAWSPLTFERTEAAPIATPVKTFRDCQEIARCAGCRPVYRCRSCKYQRVCPQGFCEWRDVCVWGPDVPVLPPNARIIRGPFRR